VIEQSERRTVRRNIRELPAPAWVLTIGAFINRFASFAVVFLVLYLTKVRGFSIARAGLAVAAVGVGEVAASVIGGHLADRIGRKWTIALSMFASAVTMLALSQVTAYGLILPVAFLAGLCSEMYRPAGSALMADVVPKGQRVTAFAVLRFAVNLGFAAGVAVAGFLANRSFFWVFASDAATSVVFGIIALAYLPHGTRTDHRDRAEGAGYRAALADRPFLLFLLSSCLVAFIYFQQQATLPLHVRGAGFSFADFGLLLSLNGAMVVCLELPLSALTMRRPPRQMIALAAVLVGAGFGLTAFAHSLWLLGVSVAVWTLGEMIGAPVGMAYVADIAPAHMRGRYQGVYGLAWASGTVTGPLIGAMLFSRGETVFWLACAVLGAVAAALVLAGPTAPATRGTPPAADTLVTLPEAKGQLSPFER
jgi:MFS family permease